MWWVTLALALVAATLLGTVAWTIAVARPAPTAPGAGAWSAVTRVIALTRPPGMPDERRSAGR
jgi:hypothetical protein